MGPGADGGAVEEKRDPGHGTRATRDDYGDNRKNTENRQRYLAGAIL